MFWLNMQMLEWSKNEYDCTYWSVTSKIALINLLGTYYYIL